MYTTVFGYTCNQFFVYACKYHLLSVNTNIFYFIYLCAWCWTNIAKETKSYSCQLNKVQICEFFEFIGWENRGKISCLVDKNIFFIYTFKELKWSPGLLNWYFLPQWFLFLSPKLFIKNGVTNHRETEFKKLRSWEDFLKLLLWV